MLSILEQLTAGAPKPAQPADGRRRRHARPADSGYHKVLELLADGEPHSKHEILLLTGFTSQHVGRVLARLVQDRRIEIVRRIPVASGAGIQSTYRLRGTAPLPQATAELIERLEARLSRLEAILEQQAA